MIITFKGSLTLNIRNIISGWEKTILAAIFAVVLMSALFVMNQSKVEGLPDGFSRTQVIGSGLNDASGFEFAPDGRIFILERTGAIKVYKNGGLLPTPFYTFSSAASGDRGLIGIAFDPNFAQNHYVYFYYTDSNLRNYLVRFDASGDVATAPPQIIFQTTVPSNLLHVGGSIRFGPDGYMYFAVGDNGYPPNAQDLSVPFGKIHRITRDGAAPADNPFNDGSGPNVDSIWAFGLRNPWRFQFDSQTSRMYSGDVGNDTWEEVNFIEKGKNYGWPLSEGNCTSNCVPYVNPVYTYNHDGQSSAVTGGPVYRGNNFPGQYQGKYFFADYARGFIRMLDLSADGRTGTMSSFDEQAGSVVDLKTGPDGSMYYVTYYPARLYKVTYSGTNQVPNAVASANQTKGVEPMNVQFSSAGSTDPENQPLTYSWNFGDGTTSTAANPAKTYTKRGVYTVNLTVSDGTNTNTAVPLVIQVGIPPTVQMAAPTDGQKYNAGESITYNVFANDAAGFDINDGDIKTDVIFHHGTHTHPFLDDLVGRSNTFVIPNSGEASPDTWYEVSTTATDTNGLATTKTHFIYPNKVNVTLTSNIPGVNLTLDGTPHATPYTYEAVTGFRREVSAPATATANGQTYVFDGWSDGGAQTHVFVTPATTGTLTANYKLSGTGTPGAGNSSFDTLGPDGEPVGIQKGSWGNSTIVFSRSTDARTGSHSGRIDMSNYVSGDAKWFLAPMNVTGGQKYIYNAWYKSNLQTKLVAEITMADGSKQYVWLGLQDPSATWKEIKYEINMPAGAQSAIVFQYLAGNGFLQLDDMSLGGYVAPPPPTTTAPNIIPNGTVEAIDLNGLPTNWNTAAWGKNTVVHKLAPGHNSTYSMNVTLSAYESGNAKWITGAIPVEAAKYKYSHWYRSNIASKAQADVTLANGDHYYVWLGEQTASATWKEITSEFELPAGSVNIKIEQYIEGNGWLETDDFVMTKVGGGTTPPPTDPGPAAELFTNGTLEAMEAPGKPQGWNFAAWGDNTHNFSVVAGHGSPSAVRVDVTGYLSGNAKWLSPEIAITAGTYHYSHWYRSNTTTKVQGVITMADGSKQYVWLGAQAPAAVWTKLEEAHVRIPAGAVSIHFEHFIEGNGWLETDDYSLAAHTH